MKHSSSSKSYTPYSQTFAFVEAHINLCAGQSYPGAFSGSVSSSSSSLVSGVPSSSLSLHTNSLREHPGVAGQVSSSASLLQHVYVSFSPIHLKESLNL
jgi:hypothetical protein